MKTRILAALCVLILTAHANADQVVEKLNGWNLMSTVDPFDDEASYSVSKGTNKKLIMLFCGAKPNNDINIMFETDEYIGSNYDQYSARLRIDSDDVLNLNVDVDGQLAFLAGGPQVSLIMMEMSKGKELYFRALTYDKGSANLQLDLTGALEAITWLKTKCDYLT